MNFNVNRLIEQLQEFGTVYGIKILAAIGILIAGRIVAGIIRALAKNAARKTKADTTITKFIGNIAYIAVMAFAVVAAINKLGVQTTSFVAILGAAGLAIGLAFQGSLSNFAAGFLMILFRPFKIGDFVETGGIAGTIRDIQVFTTTIMTPDNKKIIVPNAKITGDNIINYTSEPNRRIDLVVGVGYGDDIDKVRAVLNKILSDYPKVLKEPAPQVALSEMADSSVNFVVRPWVKSEDYWTVRFGMLETIKKQFDKEGISIPFPQRDVHLIKD